MPNYSVRCAVTHPSESEGRPVPTTLTFTDADGFLSTDGAPPLQFDLAEVVGAEPLEDQLRLVLLSGLGVRLTGLGKVAAEMTAGFLAARRDRTASSFRFGRTIGGR